jgi:uncharacterized damage-inducible protein DinB
LSQVVRISVKNGKNSAASAFEWFELSRVEYGKSTGPGYFRVINKTSLMKKNLIFLLLAGAFCFSFIAIGELTSEERAKAKDHLTASKEAVLKSVIGLSEAQLKFKPTPESWSIAECVEHIAISEDNIMGLVQKTLKDAPDPAKKALIKSDDDAIKWITDRSMKVKTSENFISKRDASVKFIETTTEDLRGHFFTFPAEVLGTMDAYQIVLFMSGHTKRHTLQIEEIKSHPDFPKQ